MLKGSFHSLLLLFPLLGVAQPQGTLIDRVVAVVGREAILHSELTVRTEQLRQGGGTVTTTAICGELEDLLYEKLLLEQAAIDSVVVDEAQVDAFDLEVRRFGDNVARCFRPLARSTTSSR